jgi:hypothetical protein
LNRHVVHVNVKGNNIPAKGDWRIQKRKDKSMLFIF